MKHLYIEIFIHVNVDDNDMRIININEKLYKKVNWPNIKVLSALPAFIPFCTFSVSICLVLGKECKFCRHWSKEHFTANDGKDDMSKQI